MKLHILFVTAFSFYSFAATTGENDKSYNSAKAQQASFLTRKEQKAAAAFFALHQEVSKLQIYLNNRDKDSLKPLLEGWSLEDQALLQFDLVKTPKNLQVEVIGQNLIFKLGNESILVKVVDASKGKFQVNNKILQIRTYRN